MVIHNRKELKEVINYEKNLYISQVSLIRLIYLCICQDYTYQRWRFVYYLRKCEFYMNRKDLISRGLYVWNKRKKNVYGSKCNIEIFEGTTGKGLLLYHNNIVINYKCSVGENCKFHGMNCVGNNGKSELVPILEDKIELGVGSNIIGNVKIPKNTIIAANSIVVKAPQFEGSVIIGNPGKEYKKIRREGV